MDALLKSIVFEFKHYREIGEKTLAQVPDEALNRVPFPDGNSLGMLVRHISGNFTSRYTDFLTADGEKPWRNRYAEFEEKPYSREEVDQMWNKGWKILEQTLDALTDADLTRTVRIRGQEITVNDALLRSLAHLSYHVGQMVMLGRLEQKQDWKWISIPKGDSEKYNREFQKRS